MSRCSPYVITLPDADRGVLEGRARSYTAPYAEVVRAKIVLLAADGERNAVIARRLGVHVGVVSKWRKRFAGRGLGGLADRKRPGRPRMFPAPVVAQVKAMAGGAGGAAVAVEFGGAGRPGCRGRAGR
jgi:Winged helix-turn helix